MKQITRTNRDIIPYKVIINYDIDNIDYTSDIILEAKCDTNSYSSYEFSIVSTTLKKYDETECIGYDLNVNPEIEIRPQLISPDSFSKRLSLQLNKSLNKGDILKIHIRYKAYGSMSGNKRYIISGSNYKKLLLNEHNISFKFNKNVPQYISVYEVNSLNNTYHFLYKIFPEHSSTNIFFDRCNVNDIKRFIKRIYVF